MTQKLSNNRLNLCQQHAGLFSVNKNEDFDIAKCGPCVDCLKPLLGSRLKNRIHSGIEEFVCKSNSRYAKQFPWVKRWLDIAIAWAEHVDVFPGEGTNVRKEMIKVNRVCRGLDSLGIEQNVLRSMNVWRFINEKDYWVCRNAAQTTQVCENDKSSPRSNLQIDKCVRESSNSDVNVEIGSITKEARIVYRNKKPNKKMNNIKLKNNRRNQEYSQSKFKLSEKSPDAFNKTDHYPKHNIKQRSCGTMTNDCDYPTTLRKRSKLKLVIHKATNTSCSDISILSKVTSLSVPCEPSQLIVRLFEADPLLSESCLILMRKKFENSIRNTCSCVNDILRKLDRSEMKELYFNCKIHPGSVKFNLRRGRGASSRMRLFLARVPTCCDIYKRYSCLRTVTNFQKCEDFQNSATPSYSCCRDSIEINASSDSCTDTRTRNIERDTGPVAFYSPCSNNSLFEEKKTHESQRSKKEVTFALVESKEKEINFVISSSCTKIQNEESVTLQIKNREKRDEPGEEVQDNNNLLCYKEKKEEEGKVLESYHCEDPATSPIEHNVQVSSDNKVCEDGFVAENLEGYVERCNSDCNYFSDSLSVNVDRECVSTGKDSDGKVCNPKQCFCHVLCVNDVPDANETAENRFVCVSRNLDNYEQVNDNVEKTECCFCMENVCASDLFDVNETVENNCCSISSKLNNYESINTNVGATNCSFYMKDVSRGKTNVLQTKQINSEGEDSTLEYTNNCCKMETSLNVEETSSKRGPSSFQVKNNISKLMECDLKTGKTVEINRNVERTQETVIRSKAKIVEEKTRTFEMQNKCSIDSLCVVNSDYTETSCDRRCSCCGESLSNPPSDDEATNKQNGFDKIGEDCAYSLTLEFLQPSSVSKVVNVDAESFQNRFTTKSRNNADHQQKRPDNCIQNTVNDSPCYTRILYKKNKFEKNSVETSNISSHKDHGTESLFVLSSRSNRRQFSRWSNYSTDWGSFSQEDFHVRGRETDAKPGSPYGRTTMKSRLRTKSKYSMAGCSSFPKNFHRIDSTKKVCQKIKEKNDYPVFSRHRHRFWRSSIVSGNICSSFPARSIDRIKDLIRKKLRKVLLEEQDKGTNTSKTFLNNDSYLVSISNMKLNEDRIIRDPSFTDFHTVGCPCSGKNRNRIVQSEKNFTKKYVCGNQPNKLQKGIRYGDASKKIKVDDFVKSFDRKRSSGCQDARKVTSEEEEECVCWELGGRNETKPSFLCDGRPRMRLSDASLHSTEVRFVDKGRVQVSSGRGSRSRRPKQENFIKQSRESEDRCPNVASRARRTYRKQNRLRTFVTRNGTEEKGCHNVRDNLRPDQWTLQNCIDVGGDCGEEDFTNFLKSYERCISDLDTIFKSKLIRYVALCRSVKRTLMKGVQSDDIYEVSSSSL